MSKSPGIENFLEALAGRTSALASGRCVDKPFGCGEPITGFDDELSIKEWKISGLCQACQDSVFGGEA